MSDKKPHHPNSLKNLQSRFHGDGKGAFNWEDPEKQKKATAAAAVVNKKRFADARAMKAITGDIRNIKRELDQQNEKPVSALELLELLMLKAVADEDLDTAADLATRLAEYQAPKLQRTEQDITTNEVSNLSDEELKKRLKHLKGII